MYQQDSGPLYRRLVSKVEEQIARGELRQGDKLPSENALAAANGVSRVTVRQALKLLTEMGLIETKKGIGSFVLVDTNAERVDEKVDAFLQRFRREFQQAMQIKLLIEPSIARRAAETADEEALETLTASWRQMDSAPDKKGYNAAAVAFHLGLVALMNNEVLLDFYRKLEKMEQMYLRDSLLPRKKSRYLRQKDVEQHGKILQAIRRKNPEMAYLYTLEHLEFFYQVYQDPQSWDRE